MLVSCTGLLIGSNHTVAPRHRRSSCRHMAIAIFTFRRWVLGNSKVRDLAVEVSYEFADAVVADLDARGEKHGYDIRVPELLHVRTIIETIFPKSEVANLQSEHGMQYFFTARHPSAALRSKIRDRLIAELYEEINREDELHEKQIGVAEQATCLH